jgi:orotidine-5'-phosphate decarboxylase
MGRFQKMKIDTEKRLIVALDLPSREQIRKMFELLFPTVNFFKLGLEAYSACGPPIVREIKEMGGSVFLDLKFHDIPTTVHRACLAALDLGADIVNIHASGGGLMMSEAAEARRIWVDRQEGLSSADIFPAIIGVTLLTHVGEKEYYRVFGSTPVDPSNFVARLARLVRESGLQGVVSSGREARLIREEAGKDFLIVTPGIRPAGVDDGGHARKVTPTKALSNGSDLLVVGRPITGAEDPVGEAKRIIDEMLSAPMYSFQDTQEKI